MVRLWSILSGKILNSNVNYFRWYEKYFKDIPTIQPKEVTFVKSRLFKKNMDNTPTIGLKSYNKNYPDL